MICSPWGCKESDTLPFWGMGTSASGRLDKRHPTSDSLTFNFPHSTLNLYLYQPTPVTSKYASPYGNAGSKLFSTPQSCGTRTTFHPESSKSGAAHLNVGRFHWQKPFRVAASRMRLISPCVKLSGADGSSPFTLEEETATHCSVLAWRIPETAGPGRLPSMGSHRVGHD